jgi:tRNA/tmRNA/rRNA uracil-C5-methylase (TrmA/RlmC/RlmD family)
VNDNEAGQGSDPVAVSERMAAGGDAIAQLDDGRVLFVEGALPGEVVSVEITERHASWARARAVSVARPSPDRIQPPCPRHHEGCGGCPWQHVEADAQVGLKQEIVDAALRRAGHRGDVERLPARRIPAFGYRTTMRVAAASDGRLGLRRRHEHSVVPAAGCMVAHPRVEELIGRSRLPGASGAILRVGLSGGERLVVALGHVAAGWSVPEDVRVVGAGERGWVHESVGGLRWRVSGRSFFQSGPAGADALVDVVREAAADALGPGATLVDAFAGVGVLGGVLAASTGCRLVAIESHPEAVADAAVNLAPLDAQVVQDDVARWPPRLADAVVADPSRRGLGRRVAANLAGTGAGRLVLVGCDPAAFARDAVLLEAEGYRLRAVALVDLFPQTTHIEAVGRFDRVAR